MRASPPIALTLTLACTATMVHGQGCVAIRSFTSCNPNAFTNSQLIGKGWSFSTNYRYFESYKHFTDLDGDGVGNDEVVERQEEHTSVFNWANQVSFAFTYNMDKRQGITFVLPWAYNTRSSLYEHGGSAYNERHKTRSQGIGDIRFTYNRWIWDPDSASAGNLQVGAGVKLPTGDHNAMDFFYNEGTDTLGNPFGQYQPVDQSIQLGDGGFGFTAELAGFLKLAGPLYGYMNAFYLVNPMATNGTLTYRSRANEAICSVPDQYMARAGFNWNASQKLGLNLFCGGRLEGIPVEDLIMPEFEEGSISDGFRRPGYVISVEPGIDWMKGRHDINLSVPIAMERNRTQSLTDIENSTPDNVRHGDAAFADYLVNLSWSIRLGGGDLLH